MHITQTFLQQVIAIVRACKPIMTGAFTVAEKGSASNLVTTADIGVQATLKDKLRQLLPQAAFLGEESDDGGNEALMWVVDPIDGTSNFTYGLAEWGVLVSVYRRMKHWQSMICLPELHRCLITGDGFRRPAGARLAGLPSIVPPDDYASLARDIEYRTMGSCAVNFYYAVTGSYRSIRHYRGAYSWDMLAGLNLALEHGLKAYVDGRPYCGEWLAPGIRHRYFVTE